MKTTLLALLLATAALLAAEPVINIESRKNGDVILYVTGGTSNVQYQVWTPANNNVADTNTWYYWRRVYSRDFLANPQYGEILVTSTNTPWRTGGVFQVRGALPDQ